MGHKGPVLKPGCIGPGRARTQLLFYSILFFLFCSILFYSILFYSILFYSSVVYFNCYILRQPIKSFWTEWWQTFPELNLCLMSFTYIRTLLHFQRNYWLLHLVILYCTLLIRHEYTLIILSIYF